MPVPGAEADGCTGVAADPPVPDAEGACGGDDGVVDTAAAGRGNGRHRKRQEPAGGAAARRGRRGAVRGRTGHRVAADAYRAARRGGTDPVLAVMSATGRSRRTSLRLIAGARAAGLLARHRPRRIRRR
ncbi:DUF6214 family protein [Streptomyces sp. NPDC000594]|uniref:DUF6214 family protein n=1 Tax=Streptomyces sp. NPDC000594 TaxID=3154261 RepID=UPI003316E963